MSHKLNLAKLQAEAERLKLKDKLWLRSTEAAMLYGRTVRQFLVDYDGPSMIIGSKRTRFFQPAEILKRRPIAE
jgi:hypothetical protein